MTTPPKHDTRIAEAFAARIYERDGIALNVQYLVEFEEIIEGVFTNAAEEFIRETLAAHGVTMDEDPTP